MSNRLLCHTITAIQAEMMSILLPMQRFTRSLRSSNGNVTCLAVHQRDFVSAWFWKLVKLSGSTSLEQYGFLVTHLQLKLVPQKTKLEGPPFEVALAGPLN